MAVWKQLATIDAVQGVVDEALANSDSGAFGGVTYRWTNRMTLMHSYIDNDANEGDLVPGGDKDARNWFNCAKRYARGFSMSDKNNFALSWSVSTPGPSTEPIVRSDMGIHSYANELFLNTDPGSGYIFDYDVSKIRFSCIYHHHPAYRPSSLMPQHYYAESSDKWVKIVFVYPSPGNWNEGDGGDDDAQFGYGGAYRDVPISNIQKAEEGGIITPALGEIEQTRFGEAYHSGLEPASGNYGNYDLASDGSWTSSQLDANSYIIRGFRVQPYDISDSIEYNVRTFSPDPQNLDPGGTQWSDPGTAIVSKTISQMNFEIDFNTYPEAVNNSPLSGDNKIPKGTIIQIWHRCPDFINEGYGSNYQVFNQRKTYDMYQSLTGFM